MVEKARTLDQVSPEHDNDVEALCLLAELLQAADGKPVCVRVACDDGTIREIEVGVNDEERLEVLALVRRRLMQLLH